MQEISLSQSGVNVGRIEPVSSLSELAAKKIAETVFSKEYEKLGFPIEKLYVLPESAVPVVVTALRHAFTDSSMSEDVLLKIGEYVLGILGRKEEPDKFVPTLQRFKDERKIANAMQSRNWARQDQFGVDALTAQLGCFALAEFVSLTQAEHFDSVFLSVVGVSFPQIPVPRDLPLLRSLFIRDGLYHVSNSLLVAASELRVLTLESDAFTHGELLRTIAECRTLERVVFRQMSGNGESDTIITQSLQQLAKSQMQDLEFDACDFSLASVCGFLLKRLERLTSFGVCGTSSIPVSVVSSAAACERLTRVSFRDCISLNESHLQPLAGGATHIKHLVLAGTGMDHRKLFKFATALSKIDRALALEILDLSNLKELSLSAVVAVMKAGTPALRHVLLERSKVMLVLEKDLDVKAALKKKARDKRIGSGKKGGGGGPNGKGKDKKKKKEKEENKKTGSAGEEVVAVAATADSDGDGAKDKKDVKKKLANDEVDLSKLSTSVTILSLCGSTMTDWVAAQLVAHCPGLESLDCSMCVDWSDEDKIPEKTRTRFNAVLCGKDNVVGLNFKKNSVFTTAVLTRHKMRHVNFMLCPDGSLLPYPEQKGGVKSVWPELRTCILPHPAKFVNPNVAHPYLTTMVLATPYRITCLPRYKTVKVVVLLRVVHQYYDVDFELADFRNVPHLVFAYAHLDLTAWLGAMGFVEYNPPDEQPPSMPAFQMWQDPDLALKRISYFECFCRESEVGSEKYEKAAHLDPKRIELFEAKKDTFKPSERLGSDSSMHRLGGQYLLFLQTVVPVVKHSFIDYREMRSLLAGMPIHPDSGRLDEPPDAVCEFGYGVDRVLHFNDRHYSEFMWYE